MARRHQTTPAPMTFRLKKNSSCCQRQPLRFCSGDSLFITIMLVEQQFHNNSVMLYFTELTLIVISNCGSIGPVKRRSYGRKSLSTRLGWYRD
jgi:hypothetical protein